MKAKESTGRKLTQIEAILVVSKIDNESVAQTAKRIEDYIKSKSQEDAVERYEVAYASLAKDTFYLDFDDGVDIQIIDKALQTASGIQYGTYDGQRFPVGTRLTSKENGELIIASPDTPEDLIVCIVEPDKE